MISEAINKAKLTWQAEGKAKEEAMDKRFNEMEDKINTILSKVVEQAVTPAIAKITEALTNSETSPYVTMTQLD